MLLDLARVKPATARPLVGGTCPVRLQPSDGKRWRRGKQILVRLMRSTPDDPHCPGHRMEQRRTTSRLTTPLRSRRGVGRGRPQPLGV